MTVFLCDMPRHSYMTTVIFSFLPCDTKVIQRKQSSQVSINMTTVIQNERKVTDESKTQQEKRLWDILKVF